MARVKGAMMTRKRRNKVLKMAKGDSLMSYIKKTYNYKADRVGRAISELEWEEE